MARPNDAVTCPTFGGVLWHNGTEPTNLGDTALGSNIQHLCDEGYHFDVRYYSLMGQAYARVQTQEPNRTYECRVVAYQTAAWMFTNAAGQYKPLSNTTECFCASFVPLDKTSVIIRRVEHLRTERSMR